MAKTNPDMTTFHIRNPQHEKTDPAVWTPDYYRELAGYADDQRAAAMRMVDQVNAAYEVAQARQAAIEEGFRLHYCDQDECDRLSAKWLANEPRLKEGPQVIAYWQKQAHQLKMAAQTCRNHAGGIEYTARIAAEKAAKQAEKAAKEAEYAELKQRVTQGGWTPQQRAQYEHEQHEKATRAQRQAAEQAKRDAERQRQEALLHDAQTWADPKTE